MITWLSKRLKLLPVNLKKAETPGGTPGRVEWEVKGSPLWFESDDTPLSPGPEAMACLCSAACALKGWRVKFPEAICPLLAGNLIKRDRIWRKWWGTHTGRFRSPLRARSMEPMPQRETAAFLSMGVDSFFTVLTRTEVDTVIYVCGFDIPITEADRLDDFVTRLRDAGKSLNKQVIVIRTNLRDHPVFRRLHWEKFHGAALAAVSHLLNERIETVLISSSFSAKHFSPWGTSWKTDHLWSSSSLTIIHTGHELTRFQKLEKIAHHAVIRDHLHVCWEHRNERFNCGTCEKCQRTMLGLLALNQLEAFSTLPDEEDLLRCLQNSTELAPYLWPTYQSIIEKGLSPEAAATVKALLTRSGMTSSTENQ